MKKSILIALIISTTITAFSQTNTDKTPEWKIKNYDQTVNNHKADVEIISEGRLLQIIPTGKSRQSYVFVFGIFESVTETRTIETNGKKENVSFSNKEYKPVEFELWADEGGDSLLEYLNCNKDLPYSFTEKTDAEKYNTPEFQPCIGSMVKLTAIKRNTESGPVYSLLKASKIN